MKCFPSQIYIFTLFYKTKKFHRNVKSDYCRHGKQMALELYAISQLRDRELSEKIEWLLDNDRFLCDSEKYEVGYTLFYTVFTLFQ